LDQETAQAVVEFVKTVWDNLKTAVQKIARSMIDWINRHPRIMALTYQMHKHKQRGGIRHMFKRQSTVHVFRSQLYIKPVRVVARSRC